MPYTLCLHFFENTSAKVWGGGAGEGVHLSVTVSMGGQCLERVLSGFFWFCTAWVLQVFN